jgi:hypothetical protein
MPSKVFWINSANMYQPTLQPQISKANEIAEPSVQTSFAKVLVVLPEGIWQSPCVGKRGVPLV